MMKHMSTKVDTAVDSLSQRIGARVRIEREGRGWSLTDLAAHSGVSRAMVHKLERGESSPTATLLARLSGAFGLSMSQLIARAEAKEGRLLRRADQPVWTDPQTRYVRTHVSPLPTCRWTWCRWCCLPARGCPCLQRPTRRSGS